MAPGLWNAMNALGAGGAQEPFLVNAANALVFGLMGFLCLFGGPIANRIGLSWTLLLGAVGYPLYSAGLYTNNRFGNVWFVLVGAAACGISAGLFWASEGAVALGYPEPSKRGKYMNSKSSQKEGQITKHRERLTPYLSQSGFGSEPVALLLAVPSSWP